MRRMVLAVVCLLLAGDFAFGASLPLQFEWDYNQDSVTIGYNLYRTDGARVLVATISGRTPPLPFSVVVPLADMSYGQATFVLTAYSATRESGDSNVVTVPFDVTPAPGAPIKFRAVVPAARRTR